MEKEPTTTISDMPVHLLERIFGQLDYKTFKLSIPLVSKCFHTVFCKLIKSDVGTKDIDYVLFRDTPVASTSLITDPGLFKLHPAISPKEDVFVDYRKAAIPASDFCSPTTHPLWFEHCTSPSVTNLRVKASSKLSTPFGSIDISNPNGVTLADFIYAIHEHFYSNEYNWFFTSGIIPPKSLFELPIIGFSHRARTGVEWNYTTGVRMTIEGLSDGKLTVVGRSTI